MTWDYQNTDYQKQSKTDPVWHLERLINYGLAGEKINKEILKKYFSQLKIPENRKTFLELLLWNKPF